MKKIFKIFIFTLIFCSSKLSFGCFGCFRKPQVYSQTDNQSKNTQTSQEKILEQLETLQLKISENLLITTDLKEIPGKESLNKQIEVFQESIDINKEILATLTISLNHQSTIADQIKFLERLQNHAENELKKIP